MLTGEYDHAGESPPDQVIQVDTTEPASRAAPAPPRSDRVALFVVVGLVIALLCLCILVVGGIRYYMNQAKGDGISLPQTTPQATASPRASAATATAGPSVRMLGKTEAQKMFEGQGILFLARKALEKYSAEELNQTGKTLTYTIYLEKSEPLAWGMGWCATTEAVLSQNFDHISYTFILNGKNILLDQFVEVEYYSENTQGYCRQYYTILTDWSPGEHLIKTIIEYDQLINDGWDDYPAGTKTYEYRVIVIH
jgi:hypothetical protein